VCRPKHVEQLRDIGIINSTTWLHLVCSFYEFYEGRPGCNRQAVQLLTCLSATEVSLIIIWSFCLYFILLKPLHWWLESWNRSMLPAINSSHLLDPNISWRASSLWTTPSRICKLFKASAYIPYILRSWWLVLASCQDLDINQEAKSEGGKAVEGGVCNGTL